MRKIMLAVVGIGALTACGAAQDPVPPQSAAGVVMTDGPRLSARRATHAMVRTSGGLIVALGGCVEDGCDPGPASATVDIFSADGTRLLRNGNLLERRVQPAAVPLDDGRILVIGGWVDGTVSASTEIFDPESGRSQAGPPLAGPRASPTVVRLVSGKVLIAGGYDGSSVQSTAQIFDPVKKTLVAARALVTARSGGSGTLLADGRVLVAGGGDGESAGRRALASAELFDPHSLRFVPTGSLGQRRYKHGAVALPDGDALIIGGSDERDYGGKLRSVERYDAAAGRFVSAGSLAVERFKLADGVMLIDPNRVLVAAGDRHPEIFDIAARSGRLMAADLGGQFNYMTLARAGERSALLAGGYREGRIVPTDRTWLFALR